MKPVRATCLVIAAAMSTLAAPTSAVAATPSNDDLRNAIRIAPLPFHHSVNVTAATRDASAPIDSACRNKTGRSVWYRMSLARTHRIMLAIRHSTYDTVLNLYRRTDGGDLRLVSCDDDSGGNLSSVLVHEIEGGARYVVMVADYADGTTSATLALQAKCIPYRR